MPWRKQRPPSRYYGFEETEQDGRRFLEVPRAYLENDRALTWILDKYRAGEYQLREADNIILVPLEDWNEWEQDVTNPDLPDDLTD